MWKQFYFKQNFTLKLFRAFKKTYSSCFGLRGNLDFRDLLQKKFYNINYRRVKLRLAEIYDACLDQGQAVEFIWCNLFIILQLSLNEQFYCANFLLFREWRWNKQLQLNDTLFSYLLLEFIYNPKRHRSQVNCRIRTIVRSSSGYTQCHLAKLI